MYLFNPTTGELKQANKFSNGFMEVTAKQYQELQLLEEIERIRVLPDLDVNQLNASYVKVSNETKLTDVTPDGVNTNGGFIGMAGADITATFDAETGNFDTIGNVTAAGADFKAKPTTVDAKGAKSPVATMSDIEASSKGITQITSPKKTIEIGGSTANTTLDVVPATSTQLGAIKAGPTVSIGSDGLLNIIMANDTTIGGVRVIGGSSGVKIDPLTGVIALDPAVSQLNFLGTLDASKNEGGIDKHKLSDSDDPNVYHGGFYVVSVPGTIVLAHGSEVAEAGDWFLFEQSRGKSDGRWIAAPVGKYQSVHSVNGKVGTVVLVKSDIGLGNVQDVDQTNADNIATGTVKVGVNTTENITTTGSMSTATLVITNKLVFMKG